MTLSKKPFEGKGENAGNWYFLLFPKCCLPFPKQISVVKSHLSQQRSASALALVKSKILFGEEESLSRMAHLNFKPSYTDC